MSNLSALSKETNLSALEDMALISVACSLDDLTKIIDDKFGEGYVEKHTSLLAGCVQACATYYLAERTCAEGYLTDVLAARLGEIKEAIEQGACKQGRRKSDLSTDPIESRLESIGKQLLTGYEALANSTEPTAIQATKIFWDSLTDVTVLIGDIAEKRQHDGGK